MSEPTQQILQEVVDALHSKKQDDDKARAAIKVVRRQVAAELREMAQGIDDDCDEYDDIPANTALIRNAANIVEETT